MPVWVQWILAIGGIITVGSVAWAKVIRPMSQFITMSVKAMPLIVEFTETFEKTPYLLKVLQSIAGEFKPDSGTSLRDVINRIEDMTMAAKSAADELKVGVETQKQMNEGRDRKMERLLVLLDRLTIRVETNTQTGQRVEQAQRMVKQDLESAKQQAEAVAKLPGAEPGEVADAAALAPLSPPALIVRDGDDLILDEIDRRTGDLGDMAEAQRKIRRATGELDGPAKEDRRTGGLPKIKPED